MRVWSLSRKGAAAAREAIAMKVCPAISAADSGQCELAAGHAGPHERHRAAPGQPPPERPVRWGSREEWAHVRQAQRRRKIVQVTLSDEAMVALRTLATRHAMGTQSAVVEDLVMAELDRLDRTGEVE